MFPKISRGVRLNFVLGAIGLFAWSACNNAQAGLQLPEIFADHMVLQTGMPVAVWGTATAGALVKVDFGGEQATATADAQGAWKTTLAPLSVSAEPRVMKVSAGTDERDFSDVLVGEVWLCSGQSNMYMPIGKLAFSDGVFGGAEEIAQPEQEDLRLFCPSSHTEWKKAGLSGWLRANPTSRPPFSSTAYYFGKALEKALHVPVGLIHISAGGSAINAWTPQEAALRVPFIAKYHDLYISNRAAIDGHDQIFHAYLDAMQKWTLADPATRGAAPTAPAPMSYEFQMAQRVAGTGLFEGLIAPVIPYSLRGVIWYQGEANSDHQELAEHYEEMLRALITSWREKMQQPQLPFYFVQLPCWDCHDQTTTWWITRQGMLNVARSMPNVGMAVTVDLGDVENLHPRNKQPVGERLALCALAGTYGQSVLHSGPLTQEIVPQNDKLHIVFDTGGSPLKVVGPAWQDIEVAGDDGKFYPATATVGTNDAVVTSASVAHPVAVRYGWKQVFTPTLFNVVGLPASPFSATATSVPPTAATPPPAQPATALKVDANFQNGTRLASPNVSSYTISGALPEGTQRPYRIVYGGKVVQEGTLKFHENKAPLYYASRDGGKYLLVIDGDNTGFDAPTYGKNTTFAWNAIAFKIDCSAPDRTNVPPGTPMVLTLSGDVPDGQTRDYRIVHHQYTTVQQGKFVFQGGKATVNFTCAEPGNYVLFVDGLGTGFDPSFYTNNLQFGWASSMESLKPSQPRPADFDAFWSGIKAQMDALPMNPVLTPVRTEPDGIQVYKFELDAGGSKLGSSDGVKAMGYYAKPPGNGPFPAMMVMYGAGQLQADINDAIRDARRGAITIALNPHPLPSDQPDDYYQKMRDNELRDYPHIGNDSRDRSYFLGMFKRCYRAARFLDSNPLWDKKHFVLNGYSQGGAQSLATAYLCPSVTALAVICPAMCDHTGYLVGRRPSWPNWITDVPQLPGNRLPSDPPPVVTHPEQVEASRYFDGMNFAAGLKIPALFGEGCLDFVGFPCVAYNQMIGPKQLIIEPDTGHGPNQVYIDAENAFVLKQLGSPPKK